MILDIPIKNERILIYIISILWRHRTTRLYNKNTPPAVLHFESFYPLIKDIVNILRVSSKKDTIQNIMDSYIKHPFPKILTTHLSSEAYLKQMLTIFSNGFFIRKLNELGISAKKMEILGVVVTDLAENLLAMHSEAEAITAVLTLVAAFNASFFLVDTPTEVKDIKDHSLMALTDIGWGVITASTKGHDDISDLYLISLLNTYRNRNLIILVEPKATVINSP